MTRQQLADLASLSRRKGRDAHGRFLVEGVRSVASALDAQAPIRQVVVRAEPGPALGALADEAGRRGIDVHEVRARDLARITDAKTSQGVLAVADRIVTDAVDVLADAPRVLLLDGVQDPGNVGTLVRTAAWFGVDAVVADHHTADFESPKVVRSAMGGLWDLALVRLPSLLPALDALAARGAEVWGALVAPGRSVSVPDWRPASPSALALGSEAYGLSEGVRQRLTGGVWIPGGAGRGAESLNVSVAGGVLMQAWVTPRG